MIIKKGKVNYIVTETQSSWTVKQDGNNAVVLDYKLSKKDYPTFVELEQYVLSSPTFLGG